MSMPFSFSILPASLRAYVSALLKEPGENTEIRAVIANGQLGTTAKAEAVIAGEGKRLVTAVNGSFAPRAQITREQAVITVMNAWRKLG